MAHQRWLPLKSEHSEARADIGGERKEKKMKTRNTSNEHSSTRNLGMSEMRVWANLPVFGFCYRDRSLWPAFMNPSGRNETHECGLFTVAVITSKF